jgi:hypothetical protein
MTIKDDAYWARLHINSDKSPAVPLKPTVKRSATVMGQGMRTSRGGFFEERRP